jgi:hypothetical protein
VDASPHSHRGRHAAPLDSRRGRHAAPLRAFLALSLAVHVAAGVVIVQARRALTTQAMLPPAPPHTGGGDTFDVPEELPMGAPEPTPAEGPGDPARTHAPRPVGARSRARLAGAAQAASAPATVFGAEGERDAVDLATAFTRGFPQAASTDPSWATVPFGAAGEADVTCEIDDAGSLVDVRVEGRPSGALRAGIARTIALVGARAFTSHARRTRLHVTASVSPDVVHDGLHGDVFAIGGSFSGGEGNAFFALAIGRRIDVTVRAR